MSYPSLTYLEINVNNNDVEFIVGVDVTGADTSTTVGVTYTITGSIASWDAYYSHYTQNGNLYTYYFYAQGLDTGYWYTGEAYLKDGSTTVDSLSDVFYIDKVYPEIQHVTADVVGNNVDFIVNIYIPTGAEAQDIYVEYWITGTSYINRANYVRTEGSGSYYTFYYNATGLDFDTYYTFRVCLADPGTTNVNVDYTDSFYIEPLAKITSFTNSVTQNVVVFTLVVLYNESINVSLYSPFIYLDVSTETGYNWHASLTETTHNNNEYTYKFTFGGLIYGETFKNEAQIIENATSNVVESKIGDNFSTNTDESKIEEIIFKPKVNKAKVEIKTTLQYSDNQYKIKIIYDRKQITQESNYVEITEHTTFEEAYELFKTVIKRLKENTKYNVNVELYNTSVIMINGGQLIDKKEGLTFKTLDGFKLWMYLWYKI